MFIVHDVPFQLYAVRYSEDGEMYRALVVDTEDESKMAEVHFIDYGNKEVVGYTEVFTLPENLTEADAYAEMMNLKGAEYALDSSDIRNVAYLFKLSDFQNY